MPSQRQESSPPSARGWLDMPDRDLLATCEVDVYRASGPGGQKRNKTSSAVRLRHGPTGLMVTATESRSQHENRTRALRRLREAIALNERNHLGDDGPEPTFYTEALERDSSLHVNRRHADYWLIVQYVLDILFACEAGVAETAERLRISTGQLVRFLKEDPGLWEAAGRMRRDFGRPPLK